MDYVLLGQKIRAARIAAGLSQEKLAEMVGLTSQHISHTEVASTKISLPSLIKIANALHTSVDMYVMLEAADAVKKSIRVRKLKRAD